MDYALKLEKVNKRYDDFELSDITFSVPKGSIVGMVGKNGAGKTTTLKAILNLISIDSGKIEVLGKEYTGTQIREDIGVVFADSDFNEEYNSVKVNSLMRKIYKKWDEKYYYELCDRFEISKEKKVKEYSRGMKMKLKLCVALAHHPSLLLLDEATSGLDPIVRENVLDILFEYTENAQHSVILSSHITSDLERISDYILFVENGKVRFFEEKDALLESYAIIRCKEEDIKRIPQEIIRGTQRGNYGCDILINNQNNVPKDLITDRVSIEDIILFLSKESER